MIKVGKAEMERQIKERIFILNEAEEKVMLRNHSPSN